MRLQVAGTPRPKGSKKLVGFGVRKRMIESSKHTMPWLQEIQQTAMANAPETPIKGPVEVNITYWFKPTKTKPPKTSKKRDRSGNVWPAVKPDGDKLERCVWDALSSVYYEDDSQIVKWSGSKHYHPNGWEGISVEVEEI
jgi:Holliday junction resolvase RusA-like endonuclease